MNKYALVKLAAWAAPKGIEGRKRLQKVVYFLQKAGCPFGAEYTLHHYGPYSRDLAEACDELVAAGFLDESAETNNVGRQYTYRMSPGIGGPAIQQTERRSPEVVNEVEKFQSLASDLLAKDLRELELGSTMLYFFEKAQDWSRAVERACKFKNVVRSTNVVSSAERLAKAVHDRSRSVADGR